jgi:peptide/nickel transport system substrate-binding protein
MIITLALAACSFGGSGATPTASLPPATATPAGPQTLNVCLGSEPSSLYLYGDRSESAQIIRQAIYDGPFDAANYAAQPVIFDGTPTPVVQAVTVHQGDMVVDAEGRVTPLTPGISVRQSGCRDGNCVLAYSGGDLQMDQVSITFTLKAGLSWSDGQPLTADDSVYSFEVASAQETPGSKDAILRTASYTAGDERTVTWTGLPGYVDPGAATRFWSPLPRHAWGGNAAADLLSNPMATQTPLGWGPYAVSEWRPGERITLTRNSNYWRAGEGLPHFATLNFVFIGSEEPTALAALADGTCDMLMPSTGLSSLNAAMGAVMRSGSWLHLDFGIVPQAYDDGFGVYVDRTDFFGDVRMRQAIAQCIDRNALSLSGFVPATYVEPDNPALNAGAASYSFDPAAANALLDQIGWGPAVDGVRTNYTYTGGLAGARLELSLVTADSPDYLAAANAVKSSLDECGVLVNINALPAAEAFATGAGSPIFGRNFDLALFAWPYGDIPACYLYLGEAVPGEDTELNKYGWGGWNVSGWRNAEFDAACQTALNSLPGEAGYAEAQQRAQAIFAEQLPALPLSVPPSLVAVRPDFCNLDGVAGSNILQGLESYGYAEWCQ